MTAPFLLLFHMDNLRKYWVTCAVDRVNSWPKVEFIRGILQQRPSSEMNHELQITGHNGTKVATVGVGKQIHR